MLSNFNVPIHAIVKYTPRAILIQHKEDTPKDDYLWIPKGWLYDIKYRKVKNKVDNTTLSKPTLIFKGFIATEVKLSMAYLLEKPKKIKS
jgi:hypothetical protein